MTIRGNIALQKMCPGTLPFECRLLRNFSFIWKLGVYNNYTGYIQSQDKLDLSLPIDLLSHQYIELSQLCLAIYVLPIASIFSLFLTLWSWWKVDSYANLRTDRLAHEFRIRSRSVDWHVIEKTLVRKFY